MSKQVQSQRDGQAMTWQVWLDVAAAAGSKRTEPAMAPRRLRELRQVRQRQAAQAQTGNPVVQAKLSGYLSRG